MRHYWIVAAFALGFCGTGCATLTGIIQEEVGPEHEAPRTPEVERIRGEEGTAGEDTLCCWSAQPGGETIVSGSGGAPERGPPPVAAQEAVLLSVGDTVRLRGGLPLFTGVARTERGILTGRSGDTLMLAPLHGSSARPWLLRPDSRLSVKRGERSFGVWKGVLLGTAIFAAGGLIYENSQSREEQGCVVVDRSVSGRPIYRCEEDRREAGVLVLPVGAIVGALAGHLIQRDRWVRVDREMLELTAERTEGSFRLSVRVAF